MCRRTGRQAAGRQEGGSFQKENSNLSAMSGSCTVTLMTRPEPSAMRQPLPLGGSGLNLRIGEESKADG